MAITTHYLITTKNLEAFFNAIISAQAPDKFTQKFLEQLEFKSTNDRLFIGLLKALGFIDDASIPKDRYYHFLDQGESKKVLTDAIKEAYEDLFAVNKEAYTLSEHEVKNKLKTILQGSKSDKVIGLMAKTFKALSDYADWTDTSPKKSVTKTDPQTKNEEIPRHATTLEKELSIPQLHYNIQIHLPESRDQSVYDAIFKSLKEHLG